MNLQIYAIVRHSGNPVITSSGLHVEANTRRFVVDEKRELYYRAEVQNRVYKRKLVELEAEISRLEHLMDAPIQPYPLITEELMYILPETRVDITPPIVRKRRAEAARLVLLTATNNAQEI